MWTISVSLCGGKRNKTQQVKPLQDSQFKSCLKPRNFPRQPTPKPCSKTQTHCSSRRHNANYSRVVICILSSVIKAIYAKPSIIQRLQPKLNSGVAHAQIILRGKQIITEWTPSVFSRFTPNSPGRAASASSAQSLVHLFFRFQDRVVCSLGIVVFPNLRRGCFSSRGQRRGLCLLQWNWYWS